MRNDNHVIYAEGEWTIEVRPRSTAHEGEPDRKVWVLKNSQEVAQYTNKYRGYDHYKDNEGFLPSKISDKSKKAWEILKEAPYSEDLEKKMIEALKED